MVTILTLSFFNVLVFNLFYFEAKVRKILRFNSLALFTVKLLQKEAAVLSMIMLLRLVFPHQMKFLF